MKTHVNNTYVDINGNTNESLSHTDLGIALQNRTYGVIDKDGEEFKRAVALGAIEQDCSVIIFSKEKTKGLSIGSAYSDRMYGWNPDKFNKVCLEVFGNSGQSFDDRSLEQIELFLNKYFDKSTLHLIEIRRWVNRSNGFPLWSFLWEEER
jgi:uncharacterized membrane protein YvbJ